MAEENTAAEATVVTETAATDVSTTEASEAAETESDTALEIQGITPPSEDELRGETVEDEVVDKVKAAVDEEKKTTEETSTESKTASSESKEEKEEDSSSGDKETKPEDKEHPRGYVPLKAVKEAREENRALKGQMSDLTNQIASLQAQVTAGVKAPVKEGETVVDPDFQVLSRDDFDVLKESDAEGALDYLYDLEQHRAAESKQREADIIQGQKQRENTQIVSATLDRIEAAFPGAAGGDDGISPDFVKFAEDVGFTPELYDTINPGTLVLLPGQEEPQLMGAQAAEIFEMLANVKTRIGERGSNRDTIRTEIRAEVQAELLEKFKSDGESAFQSMRNVQGTTVVEDTGPPMTNLNPAEFEKLTTAQKEQYLTGM